MAYLYILRMILDEILKRSLGKIIECSYSCLNKKLKEIFLAPLLNNSKNL